MSVVQAQRPEAVVAAGQPSPLCTAGVKENVCLPVKQAPQYSWQYALLEVIHRLDMVLSVIGNISQGELIVALRLLVCPNAGCHST